MPRIGSKIKCIPTQMYSIKISILFDLRFTNAITIVLSDFRPSADGNLELYLIARIAIQFWQQRSNKQVTRTQIESFEIDG